MKWFRDGSGDITFITFGDVVVDQIQRGGVTSRCAARGRRICGVCEHWLPTAERLSA